MKNMPNFKDTGKPIYMWLVSVLQYIGIPANILTVYLDILYIYSVQPTKWNFN